MKNVSYNFEYLNSKQKQAFLDATAVSKYSEKTLDAPLYEDAIILPAKENFEHGFSRYGGVIDKTGVFVSSTSWNFRSNGAYDVDKSQLKTIDKAIFIGNHTSTWGHLLTRTFPICRTI